MHKKLKIGLIGLGNRGYGLIESVFVPMWKQGLVEITAVCDAYSDRTQAGLDCIFKNTGIKPFATDDWKELVDCDDVEAVLVLSSWETHVEMCIYSMRAGKPVGVEVGCAYSVEDCFKLVQTYEETGVHCMMLENCCYGRRELMALNMARASLFGDVVHCSGGYMHDLRDEIVNGDINRHYRQRNYLSRNCENYPTHELGPIMPVLNINNGNRFVSLVSVSSCSKGLNRFAKEHRGEEHFLATSTFAQGDIVTTVIKCENGETVTLTLDTTLPRIYSRGFTVRGTKGMYNGDGDYVHLDGENEWATMQDKVGNAENYAEEYEHPIWKEYRKNPIGGHDGIDWLVYNAFWESVTENITPPIDTYDTATLMCIAALSEKSIGENRAVEFPDFTFGKWSEKREDKSTYSLYK